MSKLNWKFPISILYLLVTNLAAFLGHLYCFGGGDLINLHKHTLLLIEQSAITYFFIVAEANENDIIDDCHPSACGLTWH